MRGKHFLGKKLRSYRSSGVAEFGTKFLLINIKEGLGPFADIGLVSHPLFPVPHSATPELLQLL
jgi:hypothetical protein